MSCGPICCDHDQIRAEQGGEHPASAFSECFSEEEPNGALTYEWSLSLNDIFSFLNQEQVTRTSDLARVPSEMWYLKTPVTLCGVRT